MKPIHRLGLLALLASAGAAQASQFYVFPIKEIEGLSDKSSRPLIDPRVLERLPAVTQAALAATLSRQLAAAYPGSVVHARQVRDALHNAYKFQDNDTQSCGDGFTTPLRQSYAVVLGVTRASWYEVSREGGRVELLVPVTLNLQLVKPDSAKVVYAISETVYAPFAFAAAEMGTDEMKAKVAAVLATSLDKQVAGLVDRLKAGFKPMEAPVHIVGKTQGVLVVDQGFEVGFKAGDEPMAQNRKTGQDALFKVLSVDSGYAVLRRMEGEAGVGDEFTFTFEAQADDSRKPRVLPITSEAEDRNWTAAVADLFTKEVGFKAGFQVAPVDVNFQDTMLAISRQANCVPWEKYPSARQVVDSRVDAPDYFVRFDLSRSAVARLSGLGAVKTVDNFMTTVTAQVLDAGGNVLFSEAGHDAYKLEKTAGQGLMLANAQEISMKNATTALARRFVDNVRFVPGEFKVGSVDKTGIVVTGLALPNTGTTPVYEVLRPLDVRVNGKPTFWRLSLGVGTQAPTAVSGGTRLAYSKLEDEPRAGDVVRLQNMPRPGQSRITECKDGYRSPGSLPVDDLLPLVHQAAYRSTRYLVTLSNGDLFGDMNRLLEAGFFKLRVSPQASTDVCIKSGYAVKQESIKCESATCSAQILAATTLILEKGGERVGNFVQAEKVSFDGFAEPQAGNFVGFKAYESAYKSLPALTEKLNTTK